MADTSELAEHRARLRRFLLFLTQDREAAEDIAQDALALALQKGPLREPPERLGAWLRTTARNLALNYGRRRQTRWILFDSNLVEAAERHFVQAGAERDGYWEERQRALPGCLEKLAAPDRALVLERYRAEREVRKIAQDLGVAANTLSKRLERIRAALRECIETSLPTRSGE